MFSHRPHRTKRSPIPATPPRLERCSWNIDRRNVNPDKPDTVVEFPSCVVSVEAHPSKPGLTAVGTFNGVVFLVDTAQASGMEVVFSSPQDGKCHTEPIAQLKWLVHSDVHRRESYQLVSVGGDGKVLVWDYSTARSGSMLTLVARHLIKTADVPGFGKRGRRAALDVELGLTSIAFSCENNSTFVTGTDSGGVLKCALKSDSPRLVGGATGIDLGESSPVMLPFAAHGGPVYSVASSPFHRNMFLTASTDGTVRLYSHLETKPLLIVEPGGGYLFDVEWSISRPMVFWVSASDGRVLVYDLNVSRLKPVAVLETNTKGLPVFCTCRNEQRPRLLASGDGGGLIKIWNLSDALSKVSDRRKVLAPNERTSILATLWWEAGSGNWEAIKNTKKKQPPPSPSIFEGLLA